ncbi:MAG: NADH-quinone oxidoreductase subunit C [Chloroflexi bacterium]|nr:NADH-quinone oxidoreductase subunit C [Chloroflexota bacterium]
MTTADKLHDLPLTETDTNRLEMPVEIDDLVSVSQVLSEWGYLAAITGLDHGDRLEVLYHICHGPDVITLRVSLDPQAPTVDSLHPVFPQAGTYERELMEMFGVEVRGTPDRSRLLLPDDWPADEYPLRKEASDD